MKKVLLSVIYKENAIDPKNKIMEYYNSITLQIKMKNFFMT